MVNINKRAPRVGATPTHRIVQYGADAIGVAAGSTVEFLGASGAGGLIGVAVASVLKEIGERTLAMREQTRMGVVTVVAVNRISARLTAGHSLRKDNFFVATEGNRPLSEELFEGVLLRARDEYEERKLRHLGYFFANLAFVNDVSPSTAHLLLQRFERLTYRQLCILAAIEARMSIDVEALRGPIHTDLELDSLKREEMDLHGSDLGTLGLIGHTGAWTDILSPLGGALYHLAALGELPADEVDEMAIKLSGKSLDE